MKNKLYLLMGRSNCGKDTLFKMILNDKETSEVINVKQYTTRPIREKELDGSYIFVSQYEFIHLCTEEMIVEYRQYNVIENHEPAIWFYGTQKFEIDESHTYLSNSQVIESAASLIEKYNNFVVPIYLHCEDSILKERAMTRGDDVEEALRRYYANKHDFRWLEHIVSGRPIGEFSSIDDEIDYNVAKTVYNNSIVIDTTNKSKEEVFNEVKNILIKE